MTTKTEKKPKANGTKARLCFVPGCRVQINREAFVCKKHAEAGRESA